MPSAAAEAFTLALRTRGGAVPLPGSEHVLADLAADGLCAFVGERVVLTRSGRLLANEVTARASLRMSERREAGIPPSSETQA